MKLYCGDNDDDNVDDGGDYDDDGNEASFSSTVPSGSFIRPTSYSKPAGPIIANDRLVLIRSMSEEKDVLAWGLWPREQGRIRAMSENVS